MIGQSHPFATNAGPRLAVRFLSQWQSYFRGDVASFPTRMAMRLVERGKAERVNIAKPDQEPPEGATWALRPPGTVPLRRINGADEDMDI
jgi:hypothetical protein